MIGRKKAVSKKNAAEGRGVKCRTCYVNMGIQKRLDGGEDLLCPRCGRIWELKRGSL